MIAFDPKDPFPLLKDGSYTYLEAKEHAGHVDQFLGFKKFNPGDELKIPLQQTWSHLDEQAFQTPYIEIRSFLNQLNLQGGEKIADLGCGFGRMAHVIGRHYPRVQFTGYELVRERVEEANRVLQKFNYANCRILEWDLADKAPEPCEIFFIYDYGSNEAIEKTLQDLRHLAVRSSIRVVARGRAVRFLVQKSHAWLCEVKAPLHFATYSVFSS